jgi:hypothetical protein
LALLVVAAVLGLVAAAQRVVDPLNVIAEWTEARRTGDIEQTLTLTADNAVLFGYPMANPYRRDELVEVFLAQREAGWQLIDSDCELSGITVICQYRQDDIFLRAVGVSLTGIHRYVIRDGKIAQAERRHDATSQTAAYAAIDEFRTWVSENHPDLETVIWSSRRAVFYTTRPGARAMAAILPEYLAWRG